MSRAVKTAVKYALAISAGALMAWAVLSQNGYGPELPAAERFRILCDAFTVPGVLMIMLCCLVLISYTGALRGLTYALRHLAGRLIPGMSHREERYYDYIQRLEARGRLRGFAFLFVTGAAFMAVALVFFALFYRNF